MPSVKPARENWILKPWGAGYVGSLNLPGDPHSAEVKTLGSDPNSVELDNLGRRGGGNSGELGTQGDKNWLGIHTLWS
jgi:hypothetical protein